MRTEKAEIKISGMICRACTDIVEETLTQTRGVISARVSYYKSLASVEFDPEIVSLAEIKERIDKCGYDTGEKGTSGIVVDAVCAVLTALLVWFLLCGNLNPVPTAQTGADLGYIFLIGLLTSTHCVCMCGGILLSQTTDVSLGAKRFSAFGASLSYNGGRLLSYTVMGAIFGALGTVISYTQDVKSMVFTLVGLAVALIGLNMWGLIPGLRALSPELPGACGIPKSAKKRFGGRPLIIGLLTGLMPCGAFYAMWLFAMSSGTALKGAATMFAFTLGTVPLMLLFGALGSFIPKKLTKYMLKLSAVLVTAMGIKMLISGIKLF